MQFPPRNPAPAITPVSLAPNRPAFALTASGARFRERRDRAMEGSARASTSSAASIANLRQAPLRRRPPGFVPTRGIVFGGLRDAIPVCREAAEPLHLELNRG